MIIASRLGLFLRETYSILPILHLHSERPRILVVLFQWPMLCTARIAPFECRSCNLYIVPSRSAVDYCYLLCEVSFTERQFSHRLTLFKKEFPAFSMQGSYCGPLFRGPQRGVFCILPAVPSFLWLKYQLSLETI